MIVSDSAAQRAVADGDLRLDVSPTVSHRAISRAAWSGTMETPVRNLKGYELGERIGAGGFGAVYKAYQTTVGRDVAIKFILPSLAGQPGFIRRFEGEAQLVARLEHPHIVPLYDYWRDPDGAYLVMRWLRGGSLRAALETGPFAVDSALAVIDQVAGALAYAHRSNVIHQDIKPANILLDEDGNAYLTDFGIARDLTSPIDSAEPNSLLASADYISPEQARGEPTTVRTDVYSLGVTLYEILTGRHPFPNTSPVDRLYSHLNEPVQDVTIANPAITPAVNAVVQKATAKDPHLRYPDALALSAAFREAVGVVPASVSPVETLTLREQEILTLIMAGLANKEIAQRLTLTVGTVKWHVNQIYTKLGVRSRVQAIVRARDLHLIARPGDEHPAMPQTEDSFTPINPYKGLLPFRTTDHQDFFGRETVIARLIQRMNDASEFARFIAIVGPSGSGKSSLVKSGLIPALWRGDIPGSERWFVAELVPGAHPLDQLEIVLTRVAASQPFHLHEQLQRDRRGLVRAANLILPGDGTELVLAIDQFEETFTLVDREEERAHFLDLLYAAVTEPHSRLRVVIALRADFYDRPLLYPRFGSLVHSRLETILPLSPEELERAIVRPAERVGVAFEPGLVATIIGEINYQPGALPLLQYALTELFEGRQARTLTREVFDANGGTLGALAKRAENVYSSLSEKERVLSRQIFLRLVTLGEGVDDTRRRVTRSELKSLSDDIDMLDDVLAAFESYRLLSFDADPATRGPTVEIAHEALLREWDRFRVWLTECRDDIRVQRQLARMASEWRDAGNDPSFLAQGSRLTVFESWSLTTSMVLTAQERSFLNACIERRTSERQAEAERQERERSLERRTQTILRSLIAVLLVAVLLSGGFAIFALDREGKAQAARGDAVAAQATSESNFVRAEQQRLHLAADQAMDDFATGNVGFELAVRSLSFGYTPEADAALVRATRQGIVLQTFTGHQFEVSAVAFSPDGARVALGGEANTRIYDTESGQQLVLLNQQGIVTSVQFSSDSTEILTASGDHAQIWNAAEGTLLADYRLGADAIYAHFSSADSRIVVRTRTDYQIWDRASGGRIETMPLARADGSTIAALVIREQGRMWYGVLASDNRFVLSESPDSSDGCVLMEAGTVGFRSLWSWQNQAIAVLLTDDNIARVWNIDTCTPIGQFSGHSAVMNTIDYDPTRGVAVTGDESGLAIQWEIRNGRELGRYYTSNWILTLDISPDGRRLLMPNWNTASVWDLTYTQEPRQILTDQFNGTHFPHFSPDGEYLYIGGYGVYSRWSFDGEKATHVITYNQPIITIELSADGRYLYGALESDDHSTQLIDVETGETVRNFVGHTEVVNWVDISNDGKKVTGSSFDLTARVWDATTGDLLHVLRGHTGVVSSAMFSPDSRLIVTTSSDGILRLWDANTGESILVVRIGAPLPFADFSPDGNTLVTVDTDGLGYLIDSETGEIRHRLVGHASTAWTAKFSPDGRLVATASWDGTARLWDVETGALVRTLRDGRSTAVYWAEFSPDGTMLVTGGDLDDRVYLWHVELADVIADYCSRSPLALTSVQRTQYGVVDDTSICAGKTPDRD